MKKLFMLVLTLFYLAGCANITYEEIENADLFIDNALISIGDVDKTFDKQKIKYSFLINNKGYIEVNEDSIGIVLTDWINDNLIESKITSASINEGYIIVRGYVIFGTKDLTKKEISLKEPFISGIKIRTKNGKEILINHHNE
ncbi:MAG TPA: hypothetical protein VNM69_16160 [Bacillus sp. (in: firmicutes)]|uniref:hypothetical protein n=1 Tax=Bacillus litorisediminis TaxID=2922713 RepID=UPI001FAF20CA|nr:hypothetical protein [Bacillus litorisediminis]HWO77400.1 hypothetical protein [Bacillus sp. (in: firmicutes)]